MTRAVFFPAHYAWFVLVASLDTMLTATILGHFRIFHGREVNPLADRIIAAFGMPGMLVFKFATVVAVVIVCEAVGRRDRRTGARLASAVVVLASLPVVLALAQLAFIAFGEAPPPIDLADPVAAAVG